MKKQRQGQTNAGFTIIEVMLFLAISAGLIVALLATVGTTISRQRFSDSVTGLQAFLQQQYNETLNVSNSRGDGSCGTVDGTTGTGTGSEAIRGASDCVILGRSLDFTAEGSAATRAHITIRMVVGREPAADAQNKTGADLLKLYEPGIDTSYEDSYDIPWEAGVIAVTPAGVSRLLLLRSPDSGEVLSFGGNGGNNLDEALGSSDRTYAICIQSADILNAVGAVTVLPVSGSEAVGTKTYVGGAQRTALCGA